MWDKLSGLLNDIKSLLSKELSVFLAFILVTFCVADNIISNIDNKSLTLFIYFFSFVVSMLFYIVVIKDMKKQEYINNKNKGIERDQSGTFSHLFLGGGSPLFISSEIK